VHRSAAAATAGALPPLPSAHPRRLVSSLLDRSRAGSCMFLLPLVSTQTQLAVRPAIHERMSDGEQLPINFLTTVSTMVSEVSELPFCYVVILDWRCTPQCSPVPDLRFGSRRWNATEGGRQRSRAQAGAAIGRNLMQFECKTGCRNKLLDCATLRHGLEEIVVKSARILNT